MRRVLSCLFVLAVAGPAHSQPGKAITPDDYFTVKTITELAVSPDGKQVAYCLATWDTKADNRRTDLWVVSTDGKGTPKQLTSERASDRHPKWSADGKTIYFVGNRRKDKEKAPHNGTAQVWSVPAAGGEVTAVTSVEAGITGFDFAPKAAAVFYSADAEATDEDEFTKLRQKNKSAEYGHGTRKVSEVFRLAVGGGQVEKVIAEKMYVREFAVTADGKRVGMIVAPDDSVIRSEGDSRVDVWDAGTGKATTTDQGWKQTAGSPWPWLESVAWNADGTRLAYCTIFDGYPTEIIVCEYTGGSWPARRVDRRLQSPPGEIHIRGYGSPLNWADSDQLFGLCESHGTVGYIRWNAKPSENNPSVMAHLWPGSGTVLYSFMSCEGGFVRLAGNSSHFAELEFWSPTDTKRLTDLNPHTKEWKLPSVSHVTWKAPDGASAGGPLELPHGWKKGDKPLPLVVAIHGGPTTSSKADLEFDPHNGRLYFAAAGYAVLCPNYRGSTGYGDKFVTDLLGRENDIEVRDILAGIQHLVAEGIADPNRVAVMGWSNGGYLTNCLISLKDPPVKIRAASSGAGIVDTISEWGFNDEPAYPRVFKKGLPWETPEVYRKTSPTYGLGNVTTPTIIHVGGADERCPPGHSRMLYRALREYVKVPTELVVYSGEPHGLTKASNRRAKMEWDLAWFEKYLKGK